MPLRRAAPVTFTGVGLSDAADGTNASRGAMRILTNMLPNPTTRGTWVCRPAATDLIEVIDNLDIPDPGFVSGYIVIGDTLYGLIASALNPGVIHDQPFAYDLSSEPPAPLVVTGITIANTPASPVTTGQWTPPQFQKVGTRIVVTHPGFPGDDVKFGWFDISDFTATVTADYVSGQPFLFGGFSLLGVQPGMLVSGVAAIPAGTVVKNVYPDTQSINDITATSHNSDIIDNLSPTDFVEALPGKLITGPGVQDNTFIISTPTGASAQLSKPTTSAGVFVFRVVGNVPDYTPYTLEGDMTSGDAFITNVSPATDLHTGQLISTVNALPGTYITSIAGTQVNLSQPLIAGGGTTYIFSASGVVVELSDDATGSGTGELTISGGSRGAPQWGAGDTAVNPLPSVPLDVDEMNGRAWFACGDDGIAFSDSLQACVRSSATRALTPGNGLPATALGPLMLQTQIQGGIVAALIVFQGASAMQQIMGDPATSNLTMNALPVATGTFAPNSVAPSAKGLFFISPEGLRLIDFQANVSDPIGQDGEGVVYPFLQVSNPPNDGAAPASRICACAGGRTLRIDVPLTDGTVASYWFDMTRRIWTGPHTGAAALCRTWRDWMVITPWTREAVFQKAADEQHPGATFVENGVPLDFEWEPSLMPDNGEMAENTIIESSIMVALQPGELVQVNFLNEVRGALDGVQLRGLDIPTAYWGTAIWGVTPVGPDSGLIRQRQIPWTIPLVFKQGAPNIRGNSSATVILGNFYMRYQVLGYLLEVPQIPAQGAFADVLLSNDGVTILQANVTMTNLSPDGA